MTNDHDRSIAIITPVFNARRTISRTIDSIKYQGQYCSEYIVVDALSTDGTSEYVKSRDDVVTTHILEKDAGIYDAMNKGIRKVTAEIVGIINADDYLLPNALKQVSNAFLDPSIDYVCCDVPYLSLDEKSLGTYLVDKEGLDGKTLWHGRDWRFRPAVAHPGLFVRRRVYEILGIFDCTLSLAADHDFINRLIDAKLNWLYLSEAIAAFSMGGKSSSGPRVFMENAKVAMRYGMQPSVAYLNVVRSSLGRYKNGVLRHKYLSLR